MFSRGILLIILINNSLQDNHVKVSVFYESLQEASKSALITSIMPGYEQLKNDVDFEFEFIPYGRAKVEGGAVKCPQGENECLANKIQLCALAEHATLHNKMMFVKCAMKQDDPSDTFLINVCIKYWKFDLNKVKPCYEGSRGDQLLEEFGKKTATIPGIGEHVPAIIFNGVFDEKISTQARDHFVYVVCDMLKNKPSVCSTLKYKHAIINL